MVKMFDVKQAKQRCLAYRQRILEISQTVTALHIAPSFSCLEITDLIYNELMSRDEQGKFSDIFVMSKGHGCVIQYVLLEALGILTKENLASYCRMDGILGAHPDYGVPGISASTGSLGHGLGLAVGMAYAEKLKKSRVNVYVVISDGELQEGSVWEAIVMAANLKLSNLKVFLDLNDFTSLERISQAQSAFYPVIDKLKAFNWEVVEVDGHNTEDMYKKVNMIYAERPFMLVCNTVKGKGVSYMENVPIWHYRAPSAEEYQQALLELVGDVL